MTDVAATPLKAQLAQGRGPLSEASSPVGTFDLIPLDPS